jgi:lysophospholipase L1-like esterase
MLLMRNLTLRRAALLPALAALLPILAIAADSNKEHWVGTWATAVVARPQNPPQAQNQKGPAAPQLKLSNQTVRQIVHTSIGGSKARVVLTNAFGSAPVTIGAANIALRAEGAKIVAGSGHALTFNGRPGMTIPAGAVVLSDAVNLAVPVMGDVAIDLYLPGDISQDLTMHASASQTNYVSAAGNFAGAPEIQALATPANWFFLQGVQVMAPAQVGALVTFGDSITDGARSTANINARWPDYLARRLLVKSASPIGILNTGIGGNRLLTEALWQFGINALARFDRDVITQAGATTVVVLEGINDIGMAGATASPTAEDLIAAYEQMIERGHARGLKMIGATLTPFEGAAYWTAAGETKRGAVNAWIRGKKGYDAVIDFDAAVRDPANPNKFLPKYDSGDHLHPNDAGYEAMAAAVDVKLLKAK